MDIENGEDLYATDDKGLHLSSRWSAYSICRSRGVKEREAERRKFSPSHEAASSSDGNRKQRHRK